MGVYLTKPSVEKESLDNEKHPFRFGVSAMQGWRMNMEDAHIAIPNFDEDKGLFAVFDGHGGPEVAKYCAKYLPIKLLENEKYKNKAYQKALEEVFLELDQDLLKDTNNSLLSEFKMNAGEEKSIAGCTAVVCLIVDGEIFAANAGDSRALLYSNDNEVDPLSFDHKPDNTIEMERIRKAGGYVNNGRINDNLNLSRAIGDIEYKGNSSIPLEEQIISPFPDVQVRKLNNGFKFLLMGCDGIWETLSTEEICEFIDKSIKEKPDEKLSLTLEVLLDNLIAKEVSQGVGCDNMSAILVLLK